MTIPFKSELMIQNQRQKAKADQLLLDLKEAKQLLELSEKIVLHFKKLTNLRLLEEMNVPIFRFNSIM